MQTGEDSAVPGLERLGKGGQRRARQVIVEPLQRHDVRLRMGQNRDHCIDLRILATSDVTQQQPGALAGQFGIVCGNAQTVGTCGQGHEPKGADPRDQATW